MSFVAAVLALVLSSSVTQAAPPTVSAEPVIRTMAETHYVGMKVSHRPGSSGDLIPKLWDAFTSRISEIQGVSGPLTGLAGDFKADGTADYAAAIQVSGPVVVPPGLVLMSMPAGDYAEFTHTGPIATLWVSLDYIMGEWLPQHGYQNNGETIESYMDSGDVDAPGFQLKLLFRLKK